MALHVTRVLQDPAHFTAANDCFFHDSSVCCLVDVTYRYMRWEGKKPSVAAALDESQVRLFTSSDQGASWSLLNEFAVPPPTQWHELFSPGGNRLLAGILDPLDTPYDASFSLIPRSEDGGLTWVSAISSGLYSTMTFQARTQRFVKLPNTTTVLAFGQYEIGGAPFNVLRSTDDGVTFTAFADAGVFMLHHAAVLDATTIVATDPNNGVFSTDGGATWNAATKPGVADVLGMPIAMGGGVVLTCGRNGSTGNANVYRSVDSGQNYQLLATLPGGTNNRGLTIRALTTTVIIAGGTTTPGDLQTWWLSEDAGATWTVAGTITGDRVVASDSTSMTITTEGVMLASLDRPTRATVDSDNIGELWRGIVDGFVSTGIGTCQAEPAEPPLAAGLLGTHLLCIPILSPAPCPQLCPVDPVQPEGVLVLPTAPEGGGWFDLLGVVELVDGSVVPVVPAVTLGHPAGCGATFANNYCAVAGV